MTTINDLQEALDALKATEEWLHLDGWSQIAYESGRTQTIENLLNLIHRYGTERGINIAGIFNTNPPTA
jgi:hypothetical protein